jgi:electron transfer flavoprotein beta subunit
MNSEGNDIERDDLVYSVNEWDNYAVEEAIQIVDKVGGTVTVVTVGDEDCDEILRREMAMGAEKGLLLNDDAFAGSDCKGIATILKGAVQKGNYDLILTGAQADEGAGAVGGMLAAMLDLPYASLVNKVEVGDGKLTIGREIEGGNREMNEITLPCVLSIQTGINEPRYVGIRGIRKVSGVEIPELSAADMGIDASSVGEAGAKAKKVDYFVFEKGEGVEMFEGSTDEIIEKLIEILKANGGL